MPLHGLVHGRRDSLKSGTRASAEEQRPDSAGGNEDDTTVVEPEQNNGKSSAIAVSCDMAKVLSHIISQLRPGADLSRITLPTFILEERSMLERITNFMAHADTLLPMPTIDDPLQRFVAVVKFYLSGWHIRPPGVKKPLNPILGEAYTCYWDYPDNTRGYYISEQTSHHPPKSSYFFMAPDHHIRVDGTLKPRSKFLGNSAASMMEGISYLRFTNRGQQKGGERYIITQPNMYARGILFGKMKYELGDHSFVRCHENNLTSDLEFKTKGYFSGTYNAIGGHIKNEATGEVLYELSGLWSGEMFIKDVSTGKKTMFFDATHAKHSAPLTRPISEQGERESQRLWESTVKAVHVADHVKATEEKAKIEDRQREEAKRREEEGVEWQPKLFRRVDAGSGSAEEGEEDLEWIINANIDGKDPKTISEQILAIAPIIPGQTPDRQFEIPPHNQTQEDSAQGRPEAPPQKLAGDANLIDFGSDSRPPSVPPPTNNVRQKSPRSPPAPPAASGLMDDDDHVDMMNNQLKDLKMHEPITPKERKTLKRTDTDTGDVDNFVDAE